MVLVKNQYISLVEIWKSFCELHSDLFELTCEEYSLLLSSDVDSLEPNLQLKEELIKEIALLEDKRQLIINQINQLRSPEKAVKNIHDLLNYMNQYEKESQNFFLTKYNSLLIDIIEKIRIQNKKNQIFINKSLSSLNIIKEGLNGLKNYQTYNSNGLTGNNKSP